MKPLTHKRHIMDKSSDEVNPADMEFALKRSLVSRNKLAVIKKNDDGETEFCCVQCPAKYMDKDKMEFHLCLHTKEYRFLCGICGTGLKRKEHLERHTMEHQETRPHKCHHCGKGFKRKEHLNIHLTIHKGDKNQVCTLCDRTFHRRDHLLKHIQTHSKMFLENNIHRTDDQELSDQANEDYDIDIKEEPIELEIKSEPIELDAEPMEQEVEPFDSNDSFEDADAEDQTSSEPTENETDGCFEVRTPKADVGRPHVCEICFKSYKRKDHLKIHSWTHKEKEKCTGCGKGLQIEWLARHMKKCIYVIKDQIKQNKEASDDYDDMDDNSLLVEIAKKRAEEPESRPHECPICHRRFKRKQHLKVHANVHMKREPTIWCSRCNVGFLSNRQFESHNCPAFAGPEPPRDAKKENKFPEDLLVQEISEEAVAEHLIPTPQRVFVCRFCQKTFKRRDHYKIHLHIHTGVRDFFCTECGKGFYRKDHLQKHYQTHEKTKPKPKKQLPDLFPISMLASTVLEPKPEITITAPSNAKLRVPLQMKVPYQVVVAGGPARTVHPTQDSQ